MYEILAPPSWAAVQKNPMKAMKQVLALSHDYRRDHEGSSRWDKSASCAWNSKMCKI
eukprot:CAMPEP_0114111498 /NCGR_PEP_ID=MMETSP0043_2-20121206/1886_1 /TAXON_ID=464988 /ORGANISM="Hemiselmis andersenii, Strain CCMP644" /LENGTH=56 /DNA_ID=CAMNT_0001203535 /DNA_START=13 /DNA_END=183 /DNA_ORIENTATION=+